MFRNPDFFPLCLRRAEPRFKAWGPACYPTVGAMSNTSALRAEMDLGVFWGAVIPPSLFQRLQLLPLFRP